MVVKLKHYPRDSIATFHLLFTTNGPRSIQWSVFSYRFLMLLDLWGRRTAPHFMDLLGNLEKCTYMNAAGVRGLIKCFK